jgi:hypothetical protein
MNFRPNFEQYKIDQCELEKVPTIKPDFHFIINDISAKVLQNQELEQKEIDDLEMVYEKTQDIEKELILSIDTFRSREIISKEEFLLTATYFLTANQQGPNSTDLKRILISKEVPTQDFIENCQKVSIPENTKSIIVEVYRKIKESI